jgi:formate--tetrahydrofolate ligase
VVAINAITDDHDSEHKVIQRICERLGVRCAVGRNVAEGGTRSAALAAAVLDALDEVVPVPSTPADPPTA